MNKLLTILTITSTLFSAHCVDKAWDDAWFTEQEQKQHDKKAKKMAKSSKIKNSKLRRCGFCANKNQKEIADKDEEIADKDVDIIKRSNVCTIYIDGTDNIRTILEDDRVSNEQFSDKNDVDGDITCYKESSYYVITLDGVRYNKREYKEYSKQSKICTFKLSDKNDESVSVDVYVRYGGTHQVPFLLYNDDKNTIEPTQYNAANAPMKLANMYSVCTYSINTDMLYKYVSNDIKKQKERDALFNEYMRQYAASIGITIDDYNVEVDGNGTNQQVTCDVNSETTVGNVIDDKQIVYESAKPSASSNLFVNTENI